MDATLEEALRERAGEPPPFSLDLSQDQKDVRDWVHGFAEQLVRPAAHEWDEREETPRELIGEATKIGLYGLEGVAQFWADESGLTLPIVNEELFWGDTGIGMAIMAPCSLWHRCSPPAPRSSSSSGRHRASEHPARRPSAPSASPSPMPART